MNESTRGDLEHSHGKVKENGEGESQIVSTQYDVGKKYMWKGFQKSALARGAIDLTKSK